MGFNTFSASIYNWNQDCGKECNDKVETVQEQIYRVEEELREFSDAFYNEPSENILKELVDVLFTVLRLPHLFYDRFDIYGALKAVADNNDLKVTTDYIEVNEWKETLNDPDIYIASSITHGLKHYCLKNQEGKVIKPPNHPKVDLKEFIK